MGYTSRMPDNPLRRMIAVTKSDAVVYDPPIMLLRVATGGDVQVKDLEGNVVLITGVLDGEYVPGPFSQVMSSNTSATGFTGWKNE